MGYLLKISLGAAFGRGFNKVCVFETVHFQGFNIDMIHVILSSKWNSITQRKVFTVEKTPPELTDLRKKQFHNRGPPPRNSKILVYFENIRRVWRTRALIDFNFNHY